jgi:vesicle-fusing ATPase
VLLEVELFKSSREREEAMQMLAQAGFGNEDTSSLHIGIKKLLSVIEMARQEPDNVSQRLASALLGLGM